MLARTPLAACCTVSEKHATGYTGSVLDTFNRTVSIEGPSKEAVEAAMAEYRAEHAACQPRPAFFHIQNRDGRYVVTGSRGEGVNP
jgi:hypothetical protein